MEPTPEQIKGLKDMFKRWVDARFGGDWEAAFRATANRNQSDNTIGREELLWALEQVGVGNWITRGAWADGIIAALDRSGDRKIGWREFEKVFRMEVGTQ